jgi:hypothetical protein
VPDERWGQRVAAVVEPRPGAAPDLESIQAYCRTRVAGYKVPRELHLVDRLVRSPAGKPDYRWALTVALGDADVPEAAAPSAADLTLPAGASETSSSSPAPTPEESR